MARGSFGNTEEHKEAGRKGGEKRKNEGANYSEMGSEGGEK